ncbi:tetraspanin-15-like [Haliotis asinina]|uniref:tetraspanin-15-like n=1 Tax=Haliotis asinina TaxID=109174 RepID=UPI003531BA49
MAAGSEGMERMLPELRPNRKHPRRSMCACTAYSCNKLLLFLYTLVFVCVGIILLGIGVIVEVHRQDIQSVNNRLALPVALLIVVGLLIAINAFCGLVGTVTENPTLLKLFLVGTIIAFLLQVSIGIVAYVYREKVPDILSDELMFGVEKYTDNDDIARAMNFIQKSFKCCGFKTFEDYINYNKDFACDSPKPMACGVPYTCCKVRENVALPKTCGYGVMGNATLNDVIYTEGCTDAFLNWLASHLDYVGATALGCAIPQIFGMLLAYFFIRRVSDLRVWYRVDNFRSG